MKNRQVETQPDIYFHVGLGKAASTFLQYKVFPYLKNITYIQTTRYKHAKRIVEKGSSKTYFFSREFDRQLEFEVEKFAKDFPQAKSIIVLRRHDSWINSLYKLFVKNGHDISFPDFFNLDNDCGMYKKEDALFYKKIMALETYLNHKPLILFYEDLIDNPYGFIDQIAAYTNTSYHKEDIDLKRKHRSYRQKQLRAILLVNRCINIKKRSKSRYKIVRLLWGLYSNSIRYAVLYASLLIPDVFFNQQPLIPKKELERIRQFYENDWKKCIAYSKGTKRHIQE